MVLRLDKLSYFDMSFDPVFVEGRLKNFIVFNIFIFVLGIPLNFTELESAGIKTVEDCAVDCTSGTLFDLCKLQLNHG